MGFFFSELLNKHGHIFCHKYQKIYSAATRLTLVLQFRTTLGHLAKLQLMLCSHICFRYLLQTFVHCNQMHLNNQPLAQVGKPCCLFTLIYCLHWNMDSGVQPSYIQYQYSVKSIQYRARIETASQRPIWLHRSALNLVLQELQDLSFRLLHSGHCCRKPR